MKPAKYGGTTDENEAIDFDGRGLEKASGNAKRWPRRVVFIILNEFCERFRLGFAR